jgi:hypothetical protein
MSTTFYHPKGSMCMACTYRDMNCNQINFKKMKVAKQYSHENNPTVFKVVICSEFEPKL